MYATSSATWIKLCRFYKSLGWCIASEPNYFHTINDALYISSVNNQIINLSNEIGKQICSRTCFRVSIKNSYQKRFAEVIFGVNFRRYDPETFSRFTVNLDTVNVDQKSNCCFVENIRTPSLEPIHRRGTAFQL